MRYFSMLLTVLQVVGFVQYFIAMSYMAKNIEYALTMFISGTILITTKKIVNEVFSIYVSYQLRNGYFDRPKDQTND